MSFTVTSPFGLRLAADLEVWVTDDLGRLCDSLGRMFDQVLSLVDEVGTDGEPNYLPPWGRLLDPDLCPYADLPYLAQFVGVEIPKVATEAEARAIVKEEQGFSRGTTASIEVAIYKNTDRKSV